MVNPGLLLAQCPLYAEAVSKDEISETLADIQRRYFKRYPIDIPLDEEPSTEWLANVDDDAPDAEVTPPDVDNLDEDAAKVLEVAYLQKGKAIATRKRQLARWFLYRYRKENSAKASSKTHPDQNPLTVLMAKLTGIALQKPRRRTAYNVWGPRNRHFVDPIFEQRVKDGVVPKKQHAALRSSLYKELFKDTLEVDEQGEWEDIAMEEHRNVCDAIDAKMDAPPPSDPAERQKILNRLPAFAQPILDLIADYTGWKVTLIAGGPEPADKGRLNVVSLHAGVVKGTVKQNFGQLERRSYKEFIVPVFAHFLKKCFSLEDCRRSAIAEDVESLAFALNDNANVNHDTLDWSKEYLRVIGPHVRLSSVGATSVSGSDSTSSRESTPSSRESTPSSRASTPSNGSSSTSEEDDDNEIPLTPTSKGLSKKKKNHGLKRRSIAPIPSKLCALSSSSSNGTLARGSRSPTPSDMDDADDEPTALAASDTVRFGPPRNRKKATIPCSTNDVSSQATSVPHVPLTALPTTQLPTSELSQSTTTPAIPVNVPPFPVALPFDNNNLNATTSTENELLKTGSPPPSPHLVPAGNPGDYDPVSPRSSPPPSRAGTPDGSPPLNGPSRAGIPVEFYLRQDSPPTTLNSEFFDDSHLPNSPSRAGTPEKSFIPENLPRAQEPPLPGIEASLNHIRSPPLSASQYLTANEFPSPGPPPTIAPGTSTGSFQQSLFDALEAEVPVISDSAPLDSPEHSPPQQQPSMGPETVSSSQPSPPIFSQVREPQLQSRSFDPKDSEPTTTTSSKKFKLSGPIFAGVSVPVRRESSQMVEKRRRSPSCDVIVDVNSAKRLRSSSSTTKVQEKLSGSKDTGKTQNTMKRKAGRTKRQLSPITAKSSTSNIPKYYLQALSAFSSTPLGTQWNDVVQAWSTFEAASAYTSAGRLGTYSRPEAIHDWINRARKPTYRPNLAGSKLIQFRDEFEIWWKSLQPEWRLDEDGNVVQGDGDWESLQMAGPKGLTSIVAGLFFMGDAIGDRHDQRDHWHALLDDVEWVLMSLTAALKDS
ncbi:hypothetical protein CPB83DRAFT_840208 [Crepidotus variabilis]|uniref:Uncharacterized protein n=1 Tax=Crepidotus variabilis TaxID=179855 RepID=A0A9P6JJ84_9AGAR|nr:hypothetical protein CPB83DRAFT_840208 [Crepidotus variabilis]